MPPQKLGHDARTLRSRAEEQLLPRAQAEENLSPGQLQELVHELRVHQIELEMQNEQLRLAQGELEKARERYAELYEHAPVAYLTLTEHGLIQAANLTSTRLLGTGRAQLINAPLSRFVVKDDQDSYYLCLRKAFFSSLINSCELRLRTSGGETICGRLELLQASEEGQPVCRVTLTDITGHKRAEEAVLENQRRQFQYENEERLQLAFEAGGLGAWDQDFETGQITCNERACAMLGFTAGTVVNWQDFLQRVHPEDRPAFLNAAERSTQPGGSGRFEEMFRIILSDDRVRWVRFAARCLFAAEQTGRVLRRTGVLADITRQKEAEELLASRAHQLEILVRERTTRLQETLNELEHFSYTLVHDLRAPLRAIRGYGGLLLTECKELNPRQQHFLERTCTAAERMDQLVTDALNYNKIVHQNFVLAPIDCGALLEQLVDSYPEFLEARAFISVLGTIPPVMGNPALLTQCFSNLIGNALKFVNPGRVPSVRIFARDLGARIRVCVQDNGIGIPADCHERIFEMFQRLDQRFEGTGIGLPLVRKAAQRMHGSVGVESQPGQGSLFWVELARAEVHEAPGQSRKPS